MLGALRRAQRLGLLGARSVEEVVEHAREFVRALAPVGAAPAAIDHPDDLSAGARDVRSTVVDIGSGGGVPGLVIAIDRPDLAVTLVDRRRKSTDFLQRTVAALGLRDRVSVRCCDATTLIAAGERFGAVTARGFGPPSETLRLAAKLMSRDGRIVISEPPEGDRWASEQLDVLDLVHRREGAVAVFIHRLRPGQ